METHPPRRKFLNPSHWRIFVCVGSFTSLLKFPCTLLLRTLLLVVLTNYVHQYKEWLRLKFLENILLACRGICFDFRFVLTSWCFKNEKWEPQMKKLRKSVTVKQIANKILYKSHNFFCYFVVLSKKYFLSLLELHLREKYLEENAPFSPRVPQLFASKIYSIDDIKHWNPSIVAVHEIL